MGHHPAPGQGDTPQVPGLHPGIYQTRVQSRTGAHDRPGMKPYYDDGQITIYHGDCREILPTLEPVDLVLTDPPYGINYRSGQKGKLPRQIVGDETTELRDWLLNHRLPKPLACFATWRCQPPYPPRGCLVWHKSAGGMGDLSFPWAPTFELDRKSVV